MLIDQVESNRMKDEGEQMAEEQEILPDSLVNSNKIENFIDEADDVEVSPINPEVVWLKTAEDLRKKGKESQTTRSKVFTVKKEEKIW